MKKIIQLFAILFILQGCSLESKFGLPISTENYTYLIGTYFDKKSEVKITIETTKNNHFSLKMYEKDRENFEELKFYVSKIKNHHIINIYYKENDKTTNIFYGFRLKDRKLYFSEVTDKIRKNDFKSDDDLLSFFEKNVENDGFFHSEEYLIKDISR